jgi:hypothetical protein
MQRTRHANVGCLFGVVAAATAFVATATMSAASARADDLSSIINYVQLDYAAAQADVGLALQDFSDGRALFDFFGVEALLSSVTNEFLLPGDQIFVGTIEALSNQPIEQLPSVAYEFNQFGDPNITTAPLTLAEGVADSQMAITDGQGYLADAAQFFVMGDYGDAALYDVIGSYILSSLSGDLLIIGGVGQLLDVM